MTKQDAIFFLNGLRSANNCDETLDMAIAALSEVRSPTTQTDAQHAKNLRSGALDGTDVADRLRWILSQAERVVTVDAKDRRAVERACKLIKDIDNGFDKIRI